LNVIKPWLIKQTGTLSRCWTFAAIYDEHSFAGGASQPFP